jgi:hypothetical protein
VPAAKGMLLTPSLCYLGFHACPHIIGLDHREKESVGFVFVFVFVFSND